MRNDEEAMAEFDAKEEQRLNALGREMDKLVAKYRAQSHYGAVPAALLEGLVHYSRMHIPVGGFLEAVISNDLRSAMERADPTSRYVLFELVSWLYNEAPSDCWGSPERYRAWTERRRRVGP